MSKKATRVFLTIFDLISLFFLYFSIFSRSKRTHDRGGVQIEIFPPQNTCFSFFPAPISRFLDPFCLKISLFSDLFRQNITNLFSKIIFFPKIFFFQKSPKKLQKSYTWTKKAKKRYKLQLKLRRPKKATVALKKLRLDTLLPTEEKPMDSHYQGRSI